MLKEFNYHTRVMGCDFDMTFLAQEVNVADQYFTKAIEIARFYEKKFSRFNPESELSIINNKKSITATKNFLDVLKAGLSLYRETKGGFNPLLQVSRIGYTKSFEKIKNNKISSHIKESNYNKNIDEIVINKNNINLQKDQTLDFGGFLKGYVAEKIAQEIKGCINLIINIGGDLFVKGKDVNNKNFVIEIENPLNKEKNIFVPISDKALCTSGIYKRKWDIDGENYHHILNDMTGKNPKTDIISASVIHESGSYADAYATYAVSIGSEKAKEFLKLKNVDFIMICKSGKILRSDNLN